jgi:hypothetical protein
MDEVGRTDTYQLVNVTFLRLRIAIYCRNCNQYDKCHSCELNEVKIYLNDPGRTAEEIMQDIKNSR